MYLLITKEIVEIIVTISGFLVAIFGLYKSIAFFKNDKKKAVIDSNSAAEKLTQDRMDSLSAAEELTKKLLEEVVATRREYSEHNKEMYALFDKQNERIRELEREQETDKVEKEKMLKRIKELEDELDEAQNKIEKLEKNKSNED